MKLLWHIRDTPTNEPRLRVSIEKCHGWMEKHTYDSETIMLNLCPLKKHMYKTSLYHYLLNYSLTSFLIRITLISHHFNKDIAHFHPFPSSYSCVVLPQPSTTRRFCPTNVKSFHSATSHHLMGSKSDPGDSSLTQHVYLWGRSTSQFTMRGWWVWVGGGDSACLAASKDKSGVIFGQISSKNHINSINRICVERWSH